MSQLITEKEAAKRILDTLEELKTKVPEHTKELEAIKTELEKFKGLDGKKVLDALESLKAGQAATQEAIRRSTGGFYVPGIEEYGKKFSMVRALIAVKTGDWSKAGLEKEIFDQTRNKAGHIVGQDSAGGFWVPDQVIPDIIAAIYTRSVMVGLEGSGQTRVSVIDGLTGIPAKIPKFDGGMIAYWIGEQDKYAESQTKSGNVTMTPKKLGVLTRLTDEMQRFSSPGFENLLRTDMQRAAAKKLDWTVLFGSGTENMPRGIMSLKDIQVFSAESGNTTVPANPAGAELTFDGLMEMQGLLEDNDIDINDSFAIISATRYFRRLKQLKILNFSAQATGNPYLLGVPMLTDEKLTSIIGDWDKTTQIPTTNRPGASLGWANPQANALNGDVVAANWSEVVLGRWSGVEITNDGGTGDGFINDQTYVKMRLYIDLGYRLEKAIVVCPDAKMR